MIYPKMARELLVIGCLVCLMVPFHHGSAELSNGAEEVDRSVPARRRPIVVLATADGSRVLVANQRSGTLSVMDTASLEITSEWKVAGSIGDLVHWKKDRYLVTDKRNDRLVCIQLTGQGAINILGHVETIGAPGNIAVDPDGSRCFVAGLWSRQVAQHPLEKTGSAPGRLASKVETRFAVGEMVWMSDNAVLLATDAFGSQWATFDPDGLTAIASGDLGTRRLCDLDFMPDPDEGEEPKLAVVTQPVNRLAQAIRNDVHWGLMVANEVILKDHKTFLDPDWKESRRSRVPLGGPGEAKGDPESITFSATGEVAITIGGINEVAVGDVLERSFAYVPTGARPVDSCFSADGTRLFVANHLDDSITVVDVETYEVVETLALGHVPESTPEDQGERLFFDATVSHDGWMSCHSCHVEGHTSGFLNDNFSDQSFGAPKRILSLLGHGDTAPFAWNGSAVTLEDQIRSSIEITMQTDDNYTEEQIAGLARFVESLPAPPSLAASRGVTVDSGKGRALFADLGCAECHAGPHYTSPQLRVVGLRDELGKEEFNPPSLVGVSQRQRFLHDARYSSLRDLFEQDRHQLKRELSDTELNHLLEFLSTL